MSIRVKNGNTLTSEKAALTLVAGSNVTLTVVEDSDARDDVQVTITAGTSTADLSGYQLTSQKGQASGYASLDSGSHVPVAQLASGTPDGTKFLRDDGTFAVPAGNVISNALATFSTQGALTVAAGTGRFLFPFAATITGVRTAVNTAPTGAALVCDVNKNGTTIFTTQANRPSIAISAFSSSLKTPDVTAMAAGDYLTVDADQVGSTVAGSDLVVQVVYSVT